MYGEINRNGWAILDTLSYYDYKIDNCIDHLYKIHETKGEFLACCTVDWSFGTMNQNKSMHVIH